MKICHMHGHIVENLSLIRVNLEKRCGRHTECKTEEPRLYEAFANKGMDRSLR